MLTFCSSPPPLLSVSLSLQFCFVYLVFFLQYNLIIAVWKWVSIAIGVLIFLYCVCACGMVVNDYCKHWRQQQLQLSRVPRATIHVSRRLATGTTATFELGPPQRPSEPYRESDEGPPLSEALSASEYPSRSLSFPPPYTSKVTHYHGINHGN